jgi:DNA uptake protein ComE-like DNA-binding protein
MKILKPHFWYHKSQRNGVFFLLLIILVLQLAYSFVDFSNDDVVDFKSKEVVALQFKIDSLKKVSIEKNAPKIYPFNPNYLTDYKASKLGMSIEEIDRLLFFRKQGEFVNSAKQFQKVTLISDSLLNTISTYFKFPSWVVKRNQKLKKSKLGSYQNKKASEKSISTLDINKATEEDFELIDGVSTFLAERIVKYRQGLKGFTYSSQLLEVWKIDKRIAHDLARVFKVVEKPVIKKMNVNIATFKEVLSIPYIDYELCKKIFEYRDEVAELQSIEELKKIEGFPVDKYDRIVLYLMTK